MSRLRVLVGGGARSGKSAFALRRARELGDRRMFVATAQALDDEMRHRVARHRAERGDAYATVEEPIDLAGALAGLGSASVAPDVAVVDCLTLWLANLVLRGDDDAAIAARIDALERVLGEPPCHLVLVTNEVGFGIVPDNALSRRFRDVVGFAHQRLAARCDELYLAALGVVLRLRPEPVAVAPGAPAEAGA
jgi:adenosylcobinamide kinase/adenosylcobinamide-phosphate guanylyltransferase